MDKRELTFTSVLLGVLITVVFGAANAYLGLRVGLTVSASVPAAVVSMGIIRLVLRRDSILENNMVQTIGSAGESLAAGAIFTMPALYLWAKEGVTVPPGFLSVTIIALAGGMMGVLFMVPLRRNLIVDENERLVYPEGRACADVLKAGEKGANGAGLVFGGLGAAVLVKLVTDLFRWLPGSLAIPFRRLRGELGFEVSSALVGVGYVLGLRIASLVFAGSFLGWMVMIPVFCATDGNAAALYADGGAVAVWSRYVRFVGAGAIAAGGFLSLAKTVPQFVKTFRGLKVSGDGEDLPLGRILIGVVAVILILALAPSVPFGFGGAVLVAFFGFFFAAVSARMVGLVGSSNNPVSGMTIATLVVATFVLRTCGVAGAAGMVAAISIGSVVCIIAAIAGDTAQDLKTGSIVGATPWKQQIGELIGVTASGLAIAGTLWLLNRAWGFGGEAIPAPQATLMKNVVEGIMGGTLPWGLLAIGVALAVVLEICRVPVMPFAIGLYLPVKLNATIFTGGLIRCLVDRFRPSASSKGVLLSAGLIAGEGIAGILLALYVIMK